MLINHMLTNHVLVQSKEEVSSNHYPITIHPALSRKIQSPSADRESLSNDRSDGLETDFVWGCGVVLWGVKEGTERGSSKGSWDGFMLDFDKSDFGSVCLFCLNSESSSMSKEGVEVEVGPSWNCT
jgi:hypothetical protein